MDFGAKGYNAVTCCVAREYATPDVALPMLKLLLSRGARPNIVYDDPEKGTLPGMTALHCAVLNGHSLCAEALILAGWNPDLRVSLDGAEMTALDVARWKRDMPLMDIIKSVTRVTNLLNTGGDVTTQQMAQQQQTTRANAWQNGHHRHMVVSQHERDRAAQAVEMADDFLKQGNMAEASSAYAVALQTDGVLPVERAYAALNNWSICLEAGNMHHQAVGYNLILL